MSLVAPATQTMQGKELWEIEVQSSYFDKSPTIVINKSSSNVNEVTAVDEMTQGLCRARKYHR